MATMALIAQHYNNITPHTKWSPTGWVGHLMKHYITITYGEWSPIGWVGHLMKHYITITTEQLRSAVGKANIVKQLCYHIRSRVIIKWYLFSDNLKNITLMKIKLFIMK